MPLFKRKPFQLLEAPKDLDQNELVFQVRFTKEIFRDYQDYLDRLNLYRQRVWACKVTGKSNLTYEEALVSEHRAAEKVQQFPEELMAPVLQMIQYSTLTLRDLVDEIYAKLHEQLFVGIELFGKKDQSIYACKILKILGDGGTTRYAIGWLDKDKKVIDTSVVSAEDLIRKKPPYSRSILKAFVRESTRQSFPWVVHEKLAKEYGISTVPPTKLQNNGHLSSSRNGKRAGMNDILDIENVKKKRKTKEEDKVIAAPIKYPIDDLLVQPASDDPIFADRPPLCTEFKMPMDCVGDLLMIWNFCTSFSRLLNLWPFSLEDFANSICHKESDLALIVETHSALLRLLIKDGSNYFMAIQKKKRKTKITLVNWAEYVCDFLEMGNQAELSGRLTTIKRGHYGLLDARVKLCILRELVEEALLTDAVRERLNECVERQQVLAATKRDQTRKQKEEQHLKKEESATSEMNQMHLLENGKTNLDNLDVQENGAKKEDATNSKDAKRKPKSNKEGFAEKGNTASGAGGSLKVQKKGTAKSKESQEKTFEEQQKEHLEREMEKLSIRSSSLGKDRNHNRYWMFRREGRLFVESSDSKRWGYYSSKEELDALLGSLNPKGERERALKKQLEKLYNWISNALQKRSKDVNQKILLEEAVLRRSTRVRAQPRDSQATAYLKYVNKWKEG
ncbi:putative transcription factor & chromatin remodeling DDT family [Dioscorea sansibarensis]